MLTSIITMCTAILVLIGYCIWTSIRKEPCHPSFGWIGCKQGKCAVCKSKREGRFVWTNTPPTTKDLEV